MKKKIYRFTVLSLTVAMVTALVACSTPAKNSNESQTNKSTTAATETAAQETIVVSYPSYRVGTHVNAPSEKKITDSFNEAFKGRIELKIEELPSDQAYLDKMKVLAASGDLPDITEGKNGIRELAIKSGQAVDLTTYIKKDQAFKEEIGERAINAMTVDGKLYSISNSNFVIGYFYNKEMFEKAGITPAKTWDEWMSNLEALKKAGFTPLALMTGENCWTTNLVLAAYVGTVNEEGNKFMNSTLPKNFETPEMIQGITLIKTMFQKYTTKDAVGALYANAANSFCQEQAAIIPNGTWMTPDFSNTTKSKPGFAEKVGLAMYPNEGLVENFDIGWMMCTKDEAKRDAVWEALKWLTDAKAQKIRLEDGGFMPVGPKVEVTDEFREKNKLVAQLIDFLPTAKYTYKPFDYVTAQSVIDAFSKYYPELAFDRISPEEMAKRLSASAEKAK